MDSKLSTNLPLAFAAVLCVVTLASAQSMQTQAQPSTRRPASTSPPASLEQQPPSAPTVTYENGLLKISAYNSKLSDILLGIRSQTGTDVDIPPQAEERVVTHLGPGPPRDVLRSLLAGSQFDYVIVGSADDPNALVRILLMPRPANTNNLAEGNVSQPLMNTTVALRQPVQQGQESNFFAEAVQEDNSQAPALPVRTQQQMLQQRNQMVIEAFRLNQH